MINSPLTLKQREFAELNHNLVLKYLYEKRLPYKNSEHLVKNMAC